MPEQSGFEERPSTGQSSPSNTAQQTLKATKDTQEPTPTQETQSTER